MKTMNIIFKLAGGVLVGYVVTHFLTPHNGETNRRNVAKKLIRPEKNVKMALIKLAYSAMLISEKRKAELNKLTVERFNEKIAVNQNSLINDENHISQLHENQHAKKAVMSSTDKSRMHGVPVKAI